MTNTILTSYSLDELTAVFSDCIKKEIQHLSPPPPPEDEFITEKEAKDLLKVSKVTLKAWRDTGKITGYKIGTRVRYKRTELLNSPSAMRKLGRVAK